MRWLKVALLLAPGVLGGCSLVTDPAARQCTAPSDCGAGLFNCVSGVCESLGEVSQWSCPAVEPRETIVITALNGSSGATVEGALVTVCDGPPGCRDPRLETRTGPMGTVTLTGLAAEFAGSVTVEAAGLPTTIASVGPGYPEAGLEVGLYPPFFFNNIASFLAQPTLDETVAFGALRVVSCNAGDASGASAAVTPSPSGQTYYERSELASLNVNDTNQGEDAGILGVEPGTYTVSWSAGTTAIGTGTLYAEPGQVAESVVYAQQVAGQ